MAVKLTEMVKNIKILKFEGTGLSIPVLRKVNCAN